MLVKVGEVEVIPGQDGALLPRIENCSAPAVEVSMGVDSILAFQPPELLPDQKEYLECLGKKPVSQQRRYLPTLSDLVDRLTIVQLKSVFIPEHKEEYVKERVLIEHDIDLILGDLAKEGKYVGAAQIHAIIVIMLSNRFIWESESKARAGGSEQDKLLKLTHSINGVRNTAKNQLASIDGGRRDYKTDCFASELVADFGNWNIFE